MAERPGAPGASWRVRRWSLVVVCAILFLTFLDNTIVSVTLATLQNDLGPGITALQWIVDGYLLTFAALMLTGGTLGDLFGRKKVMLGGVAVFCAGSVVAALARSGAGADQVIAGRVIMGVGAAASEPGTLSMLRHLFPDRQERAHAIGAWAGVSGAALAFGPIVGGLLVGHGGWPDVFWFNLALGLLALVAALVVLPECSDPEGRRLDALGLALGAGAVTAATFGVIQGELSGFRTWWIVLLLAGSVALGVAFVAHERRAVDPVLKLELFREPTFTAANVVAFVTNFGVIAVFFFVVLYLAVIGTFSGYDIAAQFAAMAAAMMVAAGAAAAWVARRGPRLPTALGCLLAGGGMFAVDAVIGPRVSSWTLAVALAVVGFGFGLTLVTMTASVLTIVPGERSGMAASTVNTFRELGGVFGTAVLGAILNSQITGHLRAEMAALDLPSSIQSMVVHLVTSGGIQQNQGLVQNLGSRGGAAGACAPADMACRVLGAAYDAFYSGLHVALVISGAMLLATVPVALLMRAGDRAPGEDAPGSRRRLPLLAGRGSRER
ncbi:MAG: MFS transporter [Frankiaceae bacterium]